MEGIARVIRMFASLLRAAMKDVLGAVTKRTTLVSSYPHALRVYAEQTTQDGLAEDLRALLPALAYGTSLRGIATREEGGEGSAKGLNLAERFAREPIGSRAPMPSMEFMRDLDQYLQSLAKTQATRVENGFVKALAIACREEIAASLDDAQVSFPGTELGALLQEWHRRTVVTVAEEHIGEVLARECGVTPVLVQSAAPVAPSVRQEMRAALARNYGAVFVRFRTEPSVFGGLRVFVRGALQDQTWIARVGRVLQPEQGF